MTSTNDGKDVKSNQTSGHKGKSYYIDLYKSLEKHLSEECELRERTQHLCSAWRRVHSLCQHSAPTTHPHYLAWLQRHTANTLLQSEWQSEKDEHVKLQDAIDSFIAESKEAAASRNGHSPVWETQLVQRGEWFKRILGNPWGHPVLKVLCDPRSEPPSDEDILEWLKEERGVMFVTRLRHLAASKKCHEIALALASAVMDRKRAGETVVPDAEQLDEQEPAQPEGIQPTFKDILRTEAGFTVDVWEVLTDLELVLLHKRDEHSQCIGLAKKIPLRSGYQLVERLRSRPETSPREKKLWKNAGDVATLVAQVLITRCMVVGVCGGVIRSALYCCARSLVRLLPARALPAAAGALAAPAATARHLHTLAAAVHTQLHAQHAEDMNSFVCELYVRAITAGMNELEKLKLKTEKESEARSMEQTLASWFTSLGALLSCSARIQGECALTAFSVHPSQHMYDKIKAAPPLPTVADKQEPKEETTSEFGSWASDSRSHTNLVKTSETLNLKQTQQHTNVMSTAIFAEGEAIGLSAELCQDLTVCLSGPRVKTLSWDMDREVLLENCRTYMERTHGGTRALTTELKYLNLDPSDYQHLPEDDEEENDAYYGIEKGYEHLVELQEEIGWQEDIFDHEATETAYSSEELDEIPIRRKKKTKRPVIASEDDSDPLSTVIETIKGDKKKERPHSKERSKEKKKKSKDPEDKAKRKEKKERKKKEKAAKPGSLASLIGLKISSQDGTELGLPTVSDSDYDSQGKSSLASDGNDPNVVFDGLFTMDDPLSEKPLENSELSVVGGKVTVNKAPKRKSSVSKKMSKSSTNISTAEAKPLHSVKSVSSLLNLNQKPRPSAVGVVSEQVKRSISKLLQFRRNQNAALALKRSQNTTAKVDHKPLNAIYKPEFPTQQFISPKSVIVPEIPKSYINKAHLERLDADKSPPMLLNQVQTNDSIEHASDSLDSVSQRTLPMHSHYKSKREVVAQTSTNSSDLSSPVNKSKDILNIPKYYQNKRHNSPNILSKNHTEMQPKNISMSLSRVETPKPQEHAKSYEDFLIDLKAAANPISSPHSVIVKKDVRPLSRVSPVMPNMHYTDTSISQQCAKQVPQKKMENAPNTFSRLSYMKQFDLKHKQALETQACRQEECSKQTRTTQDYSRCLTEFRNTKIKYIQTKGDTVITRVDNPLNLSCNNNANVMRKAENNTSTSKSHPVMENLLKATTSISQLVSRYDNVATTKVTTPTTRTSYLSEKDQNDLLLLLRQQNRINAVRNVSRIGNVPASPLQAPINMTKDNAADKISSTSVMSQPGRSTSQMNNNLVQYANAIDSKEKRHYEMNHESNVIPFSENAISQGVKKATKTSGNERTNTPKSSYLESDRLDWQEVMNAIRAQKTPSRGPSALELTFMGSANSSDKKLRNQRIVRTDSVGETDKITKIVDTKINHANNAKAPKSSGTSILKTSKDVVNPTLDIQNKSVLKHSQSDIRNRSVDNEKTVRNLTPKRPSGELDKKQIVAERHKNVTTIPKNKDPFISGREDDYNLSDLDDLLDDELRRELGELSSDEDTYRVPQAQKGIKTHSTSKNCIASNKQGVVSSHSQKNKIQIPNLPHSSNNQNRTDAISANYNHPKSKECDRSQTNKSKTNVSVQNSLLYPSISKAANNENFHKNVLALDKSVPQETDSSSRCQNMTSSSRHNNTEKVTDKSLHCQYSTVQKDMFNKVVHNQTADSCLHVQNPGVCNKSPSIVEETRKVYVVPAVPQPTSNIVVLSSEMYYNPIPIIQNNLNSNFSSVNQVFIQQNNAPNIILPQPLYCAAPISASQISNVNLSVTTPSLVNIDKTSYATNMLHSSTTDQNQTRPNKTMNDIVGQVDIKTGVTAAIKTDLPIQDSTTNLDKNILFDINSNRNPERRVLSDLQENKEPELCNTTPELSRSRSISEEEVLRDLLHDQEKDQIATNNVIIKTSVINNDSTEPYSIKDIERLKRKRSAIINRRIIQSCIHPPIALSYAPITNKITDTDVCHKKSETSLERKVKVTPKENVNSAARLADHSIDINQKNPDKLQNIKKVVEVIAQEKIETPILKNDDINKETNDHSKENTSKTLSCRRIMLRSSNKYLPKIPADVKDQSPNPIARKTKVRLKTVKVQTKIDKDVNNEKWDKKDEIIPSKINQKKKVKKKIEVTKTKSNLTCDYKEHAENDNKEVCMTATLPIISSDSFDIEDALLGSLIPNMKLIKPQTTSSSIDVGIEKSKICTNKADNVVILHNKKVKLIQSQSTSASQGVVDEKSNVRVKKVLVLQNKKVASKRKRKSARILTTNSDEIDNVRKTEPGNRTDIDTSNLSDNHRVTRSVAKKPFEKQKQEINQQQTEGATVEKKYLNKNIVAMKQQTTVPEMISILKSNVSIQEKSNGNLTTSIVKTQSEDILVSSEKIINVLSKMTTNKKINHDEPTHQVEKGVKHIESKTFQNILENFIVMNTTASESNESEFVIKQINKDEDLLENWQQTNDNPKRVQSSSDTSQKAVVSEIDSEAVAKKSLLCSSNAVKPTMVEENNILYDQGKLPPNANKTGSSIVPPHNVVASEKIPHENSQVPENANNTSLPNVATLKIDEPNKIVQDKEGLSPNANETCLSNVVAPKVVHCHKLISESSQVPHNADNTSLSNVATPNVFDRSKILHENRQLQPNVTPPNVDDNNKLQQVPENVSNANSSNVLPNIIDSNKKLLEAQLPPTTNDTSKSSSEDSEKCNIPQSYKDRIIIEEIPNDKAGDVTKLLRVKLPNGKVFKASVYGKMHTSFDSLFADPSLRAMLMSDLHEQRKYTLNIKQVSKTNIKNPEKPIETRIHEIQVQTKNLAPAVVETIDLLSDDEENDDKYRFKTKSGVYETIIKDKDIIAKHQAKFDQKCYVKLEKLVLPKINDCPKDDVIEIDIDSDHLDDISLPPVDLNTRCETIPSNSFDVQNKPSEVPTIQCDNENNNTQDNISKVIEIDESSNDSIDLLKNCPDLPIELIAGLPLISNDNEILKDGNKEISEVSRTKNKIEILTAGNIDTAEITINKNQVPTLYGTSCNENIEKSLACSVGGKNENKSDTLHSNTTDVLEINRNGEIINDGFDFANKDNNSTENPTDETIANDCLNFTNEDNNRTENPTDETFVNDGLNFPNEDNIRSENPTSETFIPSKCVTPTFTVNDNLCNEFLIKPLNCYVPITRCDDLVEFYHRQNALNRSCSVSLERCDSIIESLKALKSEKDVDEIEINDGLNEEFSTLIDTSDAEVSSTASVSVLNDLSTLSEKHEENYVENGRNSPVIEIFEVIACLRKKYETDKEIKMVCQIDKFECEWLLTKQQMHDRFKYIEVQENTSFSKKTCKRQLLELSPEKRFEADILVPSLVSLLTGFFQNSNILDHLTPALKKHNINRLNKRKCSTSNLKRKMPKLMDNIIASKASKNTATEVLLPEKANTVINKCGDDEANDNTISTIASDELTNKDKSVIIENQRSTNNLNLGMHFNTPELATKERKCSKTEIANDITDDDLCLFEEFAIQNDVNFTNNIYSEDSINTHKSVSKEMKNEIKCVIIDNKNQNDIMINDVNIKKSVNKSKLLLHEIQQCETESAQEFEEKSTGDIISQRSETLAEKEDVKQKQDFVKVDILPNQNLHNDKTIDWQNDNVTTLEDKIVIDSSETVSTLNQKCYNKSDVEDSQNVCIEANFRKSDSWQYILADIAIVKDRVKIKDDEKFDVVEALPTIQNQQNEKQHLQNENITSNVIGDIYTSEVLTSKSRQTNYTMEHHCEVNDINQRIENVINELSQEIDETARTKYFEDKHSPEDLSLEINLNDDVDSEEMSPKENCMLDKNTDQFDDLTVNEYLKDVLDVQENMTQLDKTIKTATENFIQDTENYENILDTEDNVYNKRKDVSIERINDEQPVESTVIKKSKVDQYDNMANFYKKSNENIPDCTIEPDINAYIENDSYIALEVTCGDEVSNDNDHIALSIGNLISKETKGENCHDIIQKFKKRDVDKYPSNTVIQKALLNHEYTNLRQDCSETTEMQTFNELEINRMDNINVIPCTEDHVINDESDNQNKCVLKGIEFEDPDVGILYVLYPIDDSPSDTSTPNDSCDDATEKFEDKEESDYVVDNIHRDREDNDDKDVLKVNLPKTTYSKQSEYDLRLRKNLKRKIDYTDPKFTTKKYRKGKNIDYPKITAAAILEQGYTKEYKRVLDYSSSLKFSYTQPFHKDYFDIDNTMKDWPIKGPCVFHSELSEESQYNLFTDMETNVSYEPEVLKQTLEEEINQNYTEKNESSSDINEVNFNMGFGEGSGRVIKNLEDVGDISKVSAATLSDVKQPQPCLLFEDCEDNRNDINAAKDDQIEKIRQYLTYIKLHERVKSFFLKSSIELKYDGLKKNKEDVLCHETLDSPNFPFDVYMQDFIEPHPFEAIVQVVQVGQLPVSAAAQNPVTCDPRVTQVSDASPSHCSVENSPQDDSTTPIKTEYTELTTADLSLPLVQDYAQNTQTISMDSHENQNISDDNIPIETEIKSVVKIELMEELPEEKEHSSELLESTEIQCMEVNHSNNEYSYEANNSATTYDTTNVTADYETTNTSIPSEEANEANVEMIFNSTEKQTTEDDFPQHKQQNGSPEKTDQIAHAMSAAGITTTSETIANNRAHALVNILSQKIRQGAVGGNTTTANSYPKTTSINAMALQQALAQILPPPLNQTNVNDSNQQTNNPQMTPQVLHIVQGKNASGSQITLVDNSQQSVISGTNATPVLHIVQNKAGTPGVTTNGAPGTQTNSFSGLSLVDAGLQQGGNQLLHIVNTGSQKNNNAGQLLKRVNLLTNLTNVQGSNEQKMVQFVCKSADGKSIQLNAPHQRSMVLRLQPIETPVPAPQSKPVENQELSQTASATAAPNKDNAASQQEIKSRSVYEENYAKFIQNSSTKPAAATEKSTSLPKFNQAFGKPVFQDGTQKSNEISNNMPSVNTTSENNECQPTDTNTINLEHISQISSPPLLLRKSPAQTSQAQTNLVQQIKQTIAPMNIQTMHGGVIYTRQIPVNIGGGQTINLITVPSTELIDESGQKQQSDVKFVNQGEIEPSIIKIVPQSQPNNNSEISSEDNGNNMGASNENNQNPQPQPQPVLTQMRIKLPMLSKTPQMVSGARVVRPSFFQIQRNVIGGANQPVYQQLVLTAAPSLGQQTIRLPTAQTIRPQLKVPSESQSTESMSSSTLEQLREFDMVLEQVKERSTVQPNSNATNTFSKLHTQSSDATDSATSVATTPSEPTQVLYSIGNNQSLNVAYVNRKTTVSTPTTSTFVRSPDSSGIADSPTSSTHVQMSHTVTTESTSSETPTQPKPAKVGSKSKSRPKSSSNPPNSMKINPVPPKTSTQKPLEDEQTTQRILYILAEYKEQVENSPDKDKPAPRRRSNPPSNPGSSKRKKSSSGSRRPGGRDMSPVHGDDTCRTMGSEDSSCGTSQGDCNESCLDSHSPQDSPRKIVRKLTFEQETPAQQPRPQPQRNVIVADGQTITVARGTAGKPTTAVLMPANYILPVSMVKGGQQIAIVTNRGPKLLTVGGGEGGATNALLLQRLIGPAGLKPVLARPGVRHVRLPTAALHNLQAFNLATATTVQPPDSTASPAPAPTPPDLVETRATSSPWADRESQDVKPERGSSPEGSEPWNLPSSADPHDYTYEETVRADNMDRTVLDAIPDRYSPDMEAQRIFDKMFDVDSKKSYIVDSPRCGYDIDASDDDKAYHQVVQKKDGTSQRHHRLTHVSAAALRHKYAILEHELRLQKSLSEECEDLGVDSPSASELFPEAELLFAASPAHDHTQDQGQSHTPQPPHAPSSVPQPELGEQLSPEPLLPRADVSLGLQDAHALHLALDHEEFARAHPNTTFHSEPEDDAPVQPFTIAGLKGRHITSTIFHSNRAPATVLMTAPQTTVISQAQAEPTQNVKYDIDNMINSLPSSHNINLSSVLVKDDGLTRFDNILNDSRELHLTNTASAIVHSTGNATQVIRRVCYDDKRDRDNFLMDEPDGLIAGDDAKMIAEDSSRDATLESMADVDDDRSSPERHTELFWESNSASERSESRRPLDFSSDSDKCCKSPSYDETNSTDSSGVGTHMRLDSVIKDARGIERSGSADGSSADDTHPPLRTYPPKRMYHPLEGEMERSLSGKTRAGERSPDSLEVRRRASGRGVVKRGCHCCNGSPAPPRPKKSRQRKPAMDFNTN